MASSSLPPDRLTVVPAWAHRLEFDVLVRSIRDYAIFLLDLDGRILTWNEGARRFKGYEAHEIIGRPSSMFYTPQDQLEGKPRRLLAIAAEEGHVEDLGWRLRKDGSRFWADVVITAVRDEAGVLVGFCKVTRDLTERREADEQRRSLVAIFDNLPGGIATLDRDLRFKAVNRTYARILGLEPEQFPGKSVRELFPGVEGEIEDNLRGVLATGQPFTAFGRAYRLGERETFWDVSYVPVPDEEGMVSSVLVLCFEVTPRVQLEQEAAAQRLLNERIVDNVPAGIAFLDGDLVFRRVNQAYAELLGMSMDRIEGRSIYEVFPGATDQFEPLMRQVQATGVPFTTTNFPFRFTRDGVEVQTYWDFTYQPQDDGSGRTGIVILEVEVSARQESERLQRQQIERLQELDRMKDEFLSVISHELRTPLNFITGFASILEDEVQGPLNAAQHDALARILNGSDRMLTLVDDLLDFAKIQSGHLELMVADIRYQPLVDEVLASLAPLAERKGVTLSSVVAPNLIPAVDAQRVTQVLMNLVGNAIKFTESGGKVEVAAFQRDGKLVTEVRDTGCGIDGAELGKLFQRFRQLDMSTTRRAGGTGLGLAICKALVEAHGGEIGVTSDAGRGSTFWFSLPFGGKA